MSKERELSIRGYNRQIDKLEAQLTAVRGLPTQCLTLEWTGFYGQKEACGRCLGCLLKAAIKGEES